MIWTFYSFKGGVGRSMALANVAEWLYLQGLRVVAIDWDLEAPGLETFFLPDEAEVERVKEGLGVVDLLEAYKREYPGAESPGHTSSIDEGEAADIALSSMPPLRRFLHSIHEPTHDGTGAALWLFGAGWRAGSRFPDYVEAVQRFDWPGFYATYGGAAFFRRLRQELLSDQLADVVLIDSRTGVTEMGGVCTRELADVVVAMCAANYQNVAGTTDLARSFRRPDVMAARDDRGLDVVLVPSRIDGDDVDQLNRFRGTFERLVARHRLTPQAPRWGTRTFWDLRIPYFPKYSYREQLVVNRPDTPEELQTAYVGLARALLSLAPNGTALAELGDRLESPRRPASVETDEPALWIAPPRSPTFVARDEELDALRDILSSDPRRVAISGLAGIGKSSLAIEYASRFRASYDAVLWVDARGEDLVDRYEGLADRLGAGIDTKTWLRRHERWLLVIDGADTDQSKRTIRAILPASHSGHVIISSRNPAWRGIAPSLALGPLGATEAAEFLSKRSGDPDEVAGRELAAHLGGHPLALDLAATYVEESGRTLRDFVDLFRSRGPTLLDHVTPFSDVEPLSELLDSALKRDELPPQAWDLLARCAYMAASDVPLELFTERHPDAPLAAALADPIELDRAVAELRARSLVNVERNGLTIHPLVQGRVRARCDPDEARLAAADAVVLLESAFTRAMGGPEAERLAERLVPHALAALEHATELGIIPSARSRLGLAVVKQLFAQNDNDRARVIVDAALLTTDEGETRVRLLVALGESHARAGEWRKARSVLTEAEKLAVDSWLPDPERAELLEALAIAEMHNGNARGAASLLEQSEHRMAGAPAAERVTALTRWAVAWRQAGNWGKARQFLARALMSAIEVHGPRHPEVARIRVHQARNFHELGQGEQARAAAEEALTCVDKLDDPIARAALLVELSAIDLPNTKALASQLEETLVLLDAQPDPDPVWTARTLLSAARVRFRLGELDSARARLEKARILVAAERAIPPDLAQRLQSVVRMLEVAGSEGESASAEPGDAV